MNEPVDQERRLAALEAELAEAQAALAAARERERSILAAVPDMLFWIDGNGEVLDFRVPDDHLLVPRNEVIGWRVTQPPMPATAGQSWLLAVRRCLAECRPQSVRYELPLPTGARQQEVRFARLGDDRVLAMARDLTADGRRAVRSREAAVHQHERILASLNDFVWSAIVDREGDIHPRYISPVVEKITGRPPETFLQGVEHFAAIVHPDDWAQVRQLVTRFAQGELTEHEISYRIIRPDGELRWVRDRIRAEPVPEGVMLTGVVTDITGARRVEERLRETQKLEELGALAGGIAHDFNNLLVGMLGGSELACEALPETHPARRHLTAITESAMRAADLCRQMLAYAGKGSMSVEAVDLAALVGEMDSLLRTSVGHGAVLRIELSGKPCPVRGDPSQLRQLLLNLLNNAADAVRAHGGTVQLHVEPREISAEVIQHAKAGQQAAPGPYVVLSVTDDGAGMDSDVLQRIFQPFFTTKTHGHGLGLPAALGIVRTHGGVLWVRSSPGAGSLIEVALPVTEPETHNAEAAPATPTTDSASVVLVIDDEDTVLMVAGAVLESAGYDVQTATSGQQGLSLFRELGSRVSAVVLDMTMPGMGGAAVLRELRALDPSVPVIVSSGYSEEDARGELAQQEHLSFLSKPYRAVQLREAVAEAAR